MKNCLFPLFAIFLFVCRCGAQGTAFSYQGQLTTAGMPATGSYSLRFALFDTESSGNLVGAPVTNTLVDVKDGIFSVFLDFGKGPLSGSNRWIEIGVEGPGETEFTTLQPRQRIGATPYSIVAAGLAGVVSQNSIGSDPYTTIGGGSSNSVAGPGSTIGGGSQNLAQSSLTTISGGLRNQATNDFSVVGGGEYNVSGGSDSTVGGGANNSAGGKSPPSEEGSRIVRLVVMRRSRAGMATKPGANRPQSPGDKAILRPATIEPRWGTAALPTEGIRRHRAENRRQAVNRPLPSVHPYAPPATFLLPLVL